MSNSTSPLTLYDWIARKDPLYTLDKVIKMAGIRLIPN